MNISKAIVQRHGGDIQINANPHTGNTLTVLLPVPIAQASEVARPYLPAGKTMNANQASILVVDDEPAIVSCIRKLLGSSVSVRTSHSGQEALQFLSEGNTPDLILYDLMMTDLPGPELYERLQALRPELIKNTMFMTGGAFTERTRNFSSLHNSRLIQKPFEPNELRRLVKEVTAA